MPVIPGLRQLDIQRFTNITEQYLVKLLNRVAKTLNYLALPYSPGVTSQALMLISKMHGLETLVLNAAGDSNTSTVLDRNDGSKIKTIRSLFRDIGLSGKSKIRSLILYEADAGVIQSLTKLTALEKLVISRYYQRREEICESSQISDGLSSISELAKLKKLQRLNLCSKWHSLHISGMRDAQVPGCQQLEQVFYGLKATLVELRLGQWVCNDMLIYIAECVRGLEVVEINSEAVTDVGITALFRRCH